MPRGVTDQFLQILRHERRHNLRVTLVAVALLLPAYFMAELTDEPLVGRVVLLTVIATLVGIGLGLLAGRFQTTRYNASLKDAWNQWMRMSLSAASVHEVMRHVQGKGPVSGALRAIVWGGLLVANVLLFAALWVDASAAATVGAIVCAANGLILGGLAGHAAWTLHWTRGFGKALDELLAEGAVGIWGEV